MRLGVLVRSKEKTELFLKKGQIHQAIEMQEKSSNFGIKVKIIELKKTINFEKIKKEIDMVYDKCYTLSQDEREILKNFHQKCKDSNLPIFNDYEFLKIVGNKWKMHKFLRNEVKIKSYLIDTFFYNKKNFSKLFKLYPFLILKPAYGQEGIGVIEIKKTKDGFLERHKIEDGKTCKIISHKLKTFSDIESLILKLWRNNIYIVQPKIESAKFKGRVFDIRVTLQKNKKWEISGIGARAASKGSFLCNIGAGGEMFDGEKIIKIVFQKNAKTIIKNLKTTSIKIGQFLEKSIKGIVAEMGFDFMIDKKGKIWLLEINSKPSHEIFYKKEMEIVREKMTLWPMTFAKKYYANKK